MENQTWDDLVRYSCYFQNKDLDIDLINNDFVLEDAIANINKHSYKRIHHDFSNEDSDQIHTLHIYTNLRNNSTNDITSTHFQPEAGKKFKYK